MRSAAGAFLPGLLATSALLTSVLSLFADAVLPCALPHFPQALQLRLFYRLPLQAAMPTETRMQHTPLETMLKKTLRDRMWLRAFKTEMACLRRRSGSRTTSGAACPSPSGIKMTHAVLTPALQGSSRMASKGLKRQRPNTVARQRHDGLPRSHLVEELVDCVGAGVPCRCC